MRFRTLQLKFVAGLPRRWLDIAENGSVGLRLTALHQLAGSAGSYGFDRLGVLARDAEKLVGSADSTVVVDALDALKTEIDTIQAAWAPPTQP